MYKRSVVYHQNLYKTIEDFDGVRYTLSDPWGQRQTVHKTEIWICIKNRNKWPIFIYTDGSGDNSTSTDSEQKAGWGATVLGVETRPIELAGEVTCDVASPYYVDAENCTNNTGELSAILWSLFWVKKNVALKGCSRPVVLFYDSKYSIDSIKGNFGKCNQTLILGTREIVWKCRAQNTVILKKIKAHQGHKWNDHADQLANLGRENQHGLARDVFARSTRPINNFRQDLHADKHLLKMRQRRNILNKIM